MASKRLKPKQLEMALQELSVRSGNPSLEQYPTPPHIAAHLLWEISEHCGSIRDEVVLDLGCGNGILGIGCLLLGAELVCAVDVDFSALEIARGNATNLGFKEENIHFVNQDVREFNLQTLNVPGLCCVDKIDTVVMNPPFGTRDQTGIDAVFVEKALDCASTVYSMHKSSTQGFWESKAAELNVEMKVLTQVIFNIERQFRFHKSKSVDIGVDLIQFKK